MKPAVHSQNRTSLSGRKWSPAIWGRCPIDAIINGTVDGFFFQDRFAGVPDPGTITTVVAQPPYEIFGEAASSITGAVDCVGGGLNLVAGTTADGDLVVQYGGGAFLTISDTAGSDYKLWFEAQFKISTIANDVSSFFVGLTEEDRTVAAGLFQAGQGATVDSALADIDIIGFWRPDADGDGLSFVYGKSGATKQELISDMATLVADTFVNVGFIYDPLAPTERRIAVFYNNAEQSTYVTGTQIAASTFPDAEELTLCCGITNDDGSTASTLQMRGWRVAQLYDAS